MAVRTTKGRLRAALNPLVRRARPQRIDLPPSTWGLRASGSGELSLHGVSLAQLAAKYGSPMHVVNGERFDDNMRQFTLFANATSAPCKPFYSYKTNPVAGLLKRMDAHGVGAEVISPYELWLALELGVDPKNIIFNGPGKSVEACTLAMERGVGLINCNDRNEIERMAALAQKLGKRPRIGLRISTGLGWGGQFGIPIAEGREAFAQALGHKELNVVAVHSHLGKVIRTEDRVRQYVGRLLEFCDELHAGLGFSPEILDVGGSLAVSTVTPLPETDRRLNRTFLTDLLPPDPSATISIETYVKTVHTHVREHYAPRGRTAPTVYMEPGRAMTANTQLLLLRVLSIKRDKGDAASFAVCDVGINLADTARFEYHQLLHTTRINAPATHQYRVAGPVCTPGDVIYWGWKLPELNIGDCLCIMDSGAYFVPFSTSFSYPQPAVLWLDAAGEQMMRRHENFKDMHQRDADFTNSKR